MGVELRYVGWGEYPLAAGFLDTHWAKDHIYARSGALFDWTFGRRTMWDRDSYSFAVAIDGGQVVGAIGAIPFALNVRGQRSAGVWTANWMVRADRRPWPTVAMGLHGLFARPPYDTVVSFSNNPEVCRIYRAFNWQLIDDMPRHLLVLPGEEDRLADLVRLACPDWNAPRARALADAFRLDRDALGEPPGDWGRGLPADWDRRVWSRRAGELIGAVRDRDYLTWRYLEHPIFAYRLITVPEGDSPGLAVWRLETIRRQVAPGRQEEVDRIGRLVEFLPASADNARALLAALVADLESAGAFGADYYGYHGRTGARLIELGMPAADRHPDAAAIPARLSPIQPTGGRIMSAIRAAVPAPGYPLDPACPWYWTKSDSDQDRPN